MITVACEKHKQDEDEDFEEALVRALTEPISEPCPDCRVISYIKF